MNVMKIYPNLQSPLFRPDESIHDTKSLRKMEKKDSILEPQDYSEEKEKENVPYSETCKKYSADGWKRLGLEAAKEGNIILLESLYRDKGDSYEWDEWSATRAAERNHPDVVKWLYTHGCPVGKSAILFLIAHGHLEVLKWLYKRLKIDWEFAYEAARFHEQDKILSWLYKERIGIWDGRLYEYAAIFGDIEGLNYLKKHNCPWECDEEISGVEELDDTIVVWLKAHGCPWLSKDTEYSCDPIAYCSVTEEEIIPVG